MPIQEEEKISSLQLIFMIYGFTAGSSTLFPPGKGLGPDNWLAIPLGLVGGLLIALIYLTLVSRFPGKTLVEIADLVWGPYFGKLFSVAFLLYLFHLGSLVITNAVDFVKFTLLPYTPPIIFTLFAIMICAYGVSAGVEVLARVYTISMILATVMYILVDALLLPQFKLTNFQPVLGTPWVKILAAGHRAATFPFGEAVAFLMIIPFLKNRRKARFSVNAGLSIAGFFLLVATIRNTGVLGDTVDYFLYPGYSASRLINVGEVFTRVEIFIGMNFMVTSLIKGTILSYGVILGTAQLCKLKSYRTPIIPFGILFTLFGIWNFTSVADNLEFANKIYPFYALPFQVGIPLFTLIAALIRKLPREDF